MHLTVLTPSESLDRTYRLQSTTREQIELFKTHFLKLISRIDEKESEENVKDHLMDFLKEVYYKDVHVVAPKGKTDFVIHLGKDAATQAGVLFEVKRPANKGEMITRQNLNAKAFHELLLYYFRERERSKNSDIRHCVITNVYEWFIFDATLIDRLFYRNTHLAKEYKAWASGQKVSKNNELFYNEIVKPFLTDLANKLDADEIPFTYFDLRNYQKIVADEDKINDKGLLSLYKVLSPTHLLKLPTATDSNKLNSKFYAELLHLIGLEEIKEGGKKVIRRKEADKRDEGSLLENTIIELDTANKLSHLPDRTQYGTTKEEQLFSVALELCITWINRILFLKLLESQLIKYHNGNRDYSFLNPDTLTDFDELYKLFFRVLAKKPQERQVSIQAKFGRVPYLNSSLFEITDLEDATININGLDDSLTLPLYSRSVLKDNPSYKRRSELGTMTYLFAFLDAYDFASESREDIQEKNRSLINASVLGLIFEKINGYKDGSFYTPGFITEYMCRETIRKAIVQKFNDAKGWKCNDFTDLENKDLDLNEANSLINELRICDPAVGSGHFLVSALNEIIAVKSDLRVLQDETGKRLKGYTVSILNDELLVQDEDDELFSYQLHAATSKPTFERQRIQKTLFQEKQTIIENCLFGVDINPNSVKICRLRLWIELLKNAYYTDESGFAELETLPNIDINIKQGNSLLSKFSLTEDLSDVFKKQKFNVQTYKSTVKAYKEERSKDAKAELLRFISDIKNQFRETVINRDPRRKKLADLRGKRALLDVNIDIFGNAIKDPKLVAVEKKRFDRLIEQAETEIADIENNALYRGSFEWRFEFPEILDQKGEYIGFDAIIGNPPYMTKLENEQLKQHLRQHYQTSQYQLDLYIAFMELGTKVLKRKGLISYITPNSWLKNMLFEEVRKYVLKHWNLNVIIPNLSNVFDDASVDTLIFIASISNSDKNIETKIAKILDKNVINQHTIDVNRFASNDRAVFDVNSDSTASGILDKVRKGSVKHDLISDITRGVNPYDKYRGQTSETIKERLYHADYKKDNTFIPEIRGKHLGSYFYQWDKKSYISYGSWLAAPRDMKFFEGERLIMRQVLGARLICTVIREKIIIDQSVFISKILPSYQSQYHVNYLQALFSSKLLSYYFRTASNEFDELFPKIKIGEFKELPIKEISRTEQESFIVIVDQILTAKVEDVTADTSSLESEIDKLVYELYGLTDEEIDIVEGR